MSLKILKKSNKNWYYIKYSSVILLEYILEGILKKTKNPTQKGNAIKVETNKYTTTIASNIK